MRMNFLLWAEWDFVKKKKKATDWSSLLPPPAYLSIVSLPDGNMFQNVLGNFVIVQTQLSVLTQTQMVQGKQKTW